MNVIRLEETRVKQDDFNHFRTEGFDLHCNFLHTKYDRTTYIRQKQGHCGTCRKKWGLADNEMCDCGRHPDSVTWRLLPSELTWRWLRLHTAVDWLMSYCSYVHTPSATGLIGLVQVNKQQIWGGAACLYCYHDLYCVRWGVKLYSLTHSFRFVMFTLTLNETHPQKSLAPSSINIDVML